MGNGNKMLKKIHSELLALQEVKKKILANTYQIDANANKLEELSYSTQCWNYAQSKHTAHQLSVQNEQLEEANFELQAKYEGLQKQIARILGQPAMLNGDVSANLAGLMEGEIATVAA